MSCLDEEENAISQSNIDELTDESSDVSDAAGPLLQMVCAPVQRSQQQQHLWEGASPFHRRQTLDGSTRDDAQQGRSGDSARAVSSEFLDLSCLGPPQSSSSPVKRERGQQTEAAGRGASDRAAGAMPGAWATSPWRGCPRGAPGAGAHPLLDLSPASGASGPCHQPTIRLDSGSNTADVQLESENARHFGSSFATCLTGMEEDIRKKLASKLSLGDTNNLLDEEYISSSTSANTLNPPGKLNVSGVDELSETTSSDCSVCSSSSFQTKADTQAFHSREETVARACSKFDVDQFDSHNRKVKPDTSSPILIDKRTGNTVETLPGRLTLHSSQGSGASMKSQGVKFKLELGTQDTSEKEIGEGWDRNGPQKPQHQSGNTSVLSPVNVDQLFNFKSPVQTSHIGEFSDTPKEKRAKTPRNKLVTSPYSSSRQPQYKMSALQQGGVSQSKNIKWQQQSDTLLQLQQQQSGREERTSLSLNRSPSRQSTPKQSNKLKPQSSRNHKKMVTNLPDHGTSHESVTPRCDNTGWESFDNIHPLTGIPSTLKDLERNSSRSASNATSTKTLSQQRCSSQVASTVERSQQLHDSNRRSQVPVSYPQCQESISPRTASGAANRPGIVLTDEIPTRDGEIVEQMPGGSNDRTRVALTAFLAGAHRLQTVSNRQYFMVEPNSNVLQQHRTAEAGTQTVLSVPTSSATPRTVQTASPVRNLQQVRQGYRAQATHVMAIPNPLPGRNRAAANWVPTALHPISQTAPVYLQPIVRPQTYQIPVSLQIPRRYVPTYQRFQAVPRLVNSAWPEYSAPTGGGAHSPFTVYTPLLGFPASRVYYAPPVEPTWVRPAVVYYAPPNDVQWRPPARTLHRPEPHPSRQATNARVAEWLQQVHAAEAAGAAAEEAAGAAAGAASSATTSSDSGIQAPASASASAGSRSASSQASAELGNSLHARLAAPHAGESPSRATTARSQQSAQSAIAELWKL